MRGVGLDMILKSASIVLFASLASCAQSASISITSVNDTSKKDDALYQECKKVDFAVSESRLRKFLDESQPMGVEEWVELDHFPCERQIGFISGGEKSQISINLSGAAVKVTKAGVVYLYCDEGCLRRAGWGGVSKRDQE